MGKFHGIKMQLWGVGVESQIDFTSFHHRYAAWKCRELWMLSNLFTGPSASSEHLFHARHSANGCGHKELKEKFPDLFDLWCGEGSRSVNSMRGTGQRGPQGVKRGARLREQFILLQPKQRDSTEESRLLRETLHKLRQTHFDPRHQSSLEPSSKPQGLSDAQGHCRSPWPTIGQSQHQREPSHLCPQQPVLPWDPAAAWGPMEASGSLSRAQGPPHAHSYFSTHVFPTLNTLTSRLPSSVCWESTKWGIRTRFGTDSIQMLRKFQKGYHHLCTCKW